MVNAAKKADDLALARLLAAEEDFRNIDAVDSEGRTTLLFVFGRVLGNVVCIFW